MTARININVFPGLFNGAIMLSGHSLNSWALTRKPLEYMRNVAEVLGIPTRNKKMMLEELRNFPAKEIQKATDPVFKTVSVFVTDVQITKILI